MKKKMHRAFSEKDLAFIRRWYGRKTVANIAKSLHRSERCIYIKANSLGLHVRGRKAWTEEDLKTLCFYYGQIPRRELARKLGRSEFSVNSKIFDLKIDCSRKVDMTTCRAPMTRNGAQKVYWTAAMLNDIRTLFPNTTNEELAAICHVSMSTMSRKAKELGLKKDPEWLKETYDHGRKLARITNLAKQNKGEWQYRADHKESASRGGISTMKKRKSYRTNFLLKQFGQDIDSNKIH